MTRLVGRHLKIHPRVSHCTLAFSASAIPDELAQLPEGYELEVLTKPRGKGEKGRVRAFSHIRL